MITILDKKLPIELSDKIYKIYHKNIMDEITDILTHKTIFALVREKDDFKLSFLICENQRYSSNIIDLLYSK